MASGQKCSLIVQKAGVASSGSCLWELARSLASIYEMYGLLSPAQELGVFWLLPVEHQKLGVKQLNNHSQFQSLGKNVFVPIKLCTQSTALL